jgi:hypothetical protein
MRARVVLLLEDVPTLAARAALERIAASEAGDQLVQTAREVLRRTFPAPASRSRNSSTRP